MNNKAGKAKAKIVKDTDDLFDSRATVVIDEYLSKMQKVKGQKESEKIRRAFRTTGIADSNSRIVEWHERLLTGIAFIDDQNKQFIKLINGLYSTSRMGWQYSKEAFVNVARFVLRYFTNLKSEEKLMLRTGYPEYQAHKQEHARFRKDIINYVETYKAGHNIDVAIFVLYLRDWIVVHNTNDKKMSLYLTKLKQEGKIKNILE
jgi:hemerythrin-like metal-binding protein